MTKAHDLLGELGMTIEKGSTTAYPAASTGPNPQMRYWATEISLRNEIQFGAQMRASNEKVPGEMIDRLESWGFVLRNNGREIYRSIPATKNSALQEAKLIKAVLEAL